MGNNRKKVPGLNTSSTADISFMLLIFFLVTTQMTQDKGLARRLSPPPKPEEENLTKVVNERNIFILLVNDHGQIMAKTKKQTVVYEPTDRTRYDEIRERIKVFVKNENFDPELPDRVHLDDPIPGMPPGENFRNPTKDHVVSLQCQEGAPYSVYFELQNCVVRAYNELREEMAQELYHRPFSSLNETQMTAIRTYYAQRISEAEPRQRNN